MKPLRYLALGDSYTIGEGVDAAERWPAQLAAALGERGVPVSQPEIIAVTGWTTDELDAGIDAASPNPEWDLVSLLIGVNNAYRGRDVDEYRVEFSALLDRAVGFAGGRHERVFVLSIPDWSATPFARESDRDLAAESALIDRYNSAARTVCQEREVAWFDVTPSTRAMAHDPQLVTDDGLHPSGELYRRWVDRIVVPLSRRLAGQ